MLADDLRRVNQLLKESSAQAAVEQCRVLLKSHPENVEILRYLGLGYLQQHEWVKADHYLSRTLRAAPASPNLLNEIGIVKLKQEAYEEAVSFFSRALDLDPTHSDALNNIATTFNIQQQPSKATHYLERLMHVLPFSSQVHVKAADNSLALNDVEQAIRRGRTAVRLAPHNSAARLSLADALEAGGRFKQAKYQYLSVLSRQPGQIPALSKLLAMKGTHVAEQHQHQAQQLLDGSSLRDADRIQLHLGLARYCDQRRDYDRAFEHLHAANSIKFRNHTFDSSLHGRAVDRLIGVFTKQFVQSLPSHEVRSTRPIFIVGMPRSGTTLVEQILASHSRIAAGGELSTIINIAAQIGQNGVTYPEGMERLDGPALGHMANQYLERLNAISPDAPRVTDKMPFNFMHLGLIRVLFPAATIIHCRRDALDTCLSCFFTTFSEHLQFASHLETLGRYYLDYRRLMTHWRAVLPAPWLDLQYERLVDNTEEAVREILKFCGVDWEAACVQFHRTERGVRTPSRWQVRQPVYRHSVGRWRHYERNLQPLLEILEPVLLEDTKRAGMLS